MKDSKIFGKINIIDFIVVLFLLVLISGIVLVKTKRHVTSSKIVTGESEVVFDVSLNSVKLTTNEEILKPDGKTFITIRNVPYTALDILDVKKNHVKIIVRQTDNSALPVLTNDLTRPDVYNYVVTLKDKGSITNDGAVIGGNKIKIGLHVRLEGIKYILSGVVSDVRFENQE